MVVIPENRARLGELGEKFLVQGQLMKMRLWEEDPASSSSKPSAQGMHHRPYETVGYVLSGTAELKIGGARVTLSKGVSWLVPAYCEHEYIIKEGPFKAVEVISQEGGYTTPAEVSKEQKEAAELRGKSLLK
ncbi:hypothetical protein QOT17_022489 [Balamuthia mandrillaris]